MPVCHGHGYSSGGLKAASCGGVVLYRPKDGPDAASNATCHATAPWNASSWFNAAFRAYALPSSRNDASR